MEGGRRREGEIEIGECECSKPVQVYLMIWLP